MEAMANLLDVARAARVSSATVSRSLNEPATVTEETRERVFAAMRRLAYQPNRVAGRLRQRPGRRRILGLIIPEIENPHFAEIVRGVEDTAQAQKTAVILCNSDDDPAKQKFYLDLMRGENVDGVIVPPVTVRDPALLAAIAAQLPVVVIDRRLAFRRTDSVLVDNREGTRLAIDHLMSRGYTTIAHIAGPQQLFTSSERKEAWAASLKAHGLERPENYLIIADNQRAGGMAAAEKLLSLPKPPRAIYINNNLMAMGALEVIRLRRVVNATPMLVSVVKNGPTMIYLAVKDISSCW